MCCYNAFCRPHINKISQFYRQLSHLFHTYIKIAVGGGLLFIGIRVKNAKIQGMCALDTDPKSF
jgi:hypothetical protein